MDSNDTKTSVADRKSEFVPVSGGQDTTSAEALLITAYVLMWLFVFVFVYRTWSRQRALEGRLVELEGALAALDQQGGAKGHPEQDSDALGRAGAD